MIQFSLANVIESLFYSALTFCTDIPSHLFRQSSQELHICMRQCQIQCLIRCCCIPFLFCLFIWKLTTFFIILQILEQLFSYRGQVLFSKGRLLGNNERVLNSRGWLLGVRAKRKGSPSQADYQRGPSGLQKGCFLLRRTRF